MMHLVFLAINLKLYNAKMFMLSIFFQLITSIYITSFFIDGCTSSALAIIIAYYEHLKIGKINNHVKSVYDSLDTIKVHRAVKAFTEEHNRYCTHINAVNQFWKNLFLTFFATMLPINLTIMHQLLFEDIPLQLRLLYVVCMFCSDVQLFGLQFLLASLTVKIHSMYAKLSRLQWCLKGSRIRVKWKLIMCFERLSSTKHRIGITMGSIVFTMPLFAKVLIKILFNFLIIIIF